MRKLKKLTFSQLKLSKIKLEEVFTPATAAEVNDIGSKEIAPIIIKNENTRETNNSIWTLGELGNIFG